MDLRAPDTIRPWPPSARGRSRYRHDLALAFRLDQRKAVAADAGRLRLDHPEQRTGRDRRVRRVPPARITSMATSAASGCDVATIAFWAWTVERPAKWKIPHRECFLSAFLHVLASRGERSGGLQTVLWHIHPRWAMAGMPRVRQWQCAEYAGLYGVSPARPA
jgi:hypothetical protein